MESKAIEIRDEGTFIPALALRVSGEDGYLFRRSGFNSPLVILIQLNLMKCEYDPYDWNSPRTMPNAHNFIAEHWDSLKDGDVVDVSFILGESQTPKVSESVTCR